MNIDAELAARVTEGLKGGRFIEMRVIGGAPNTFVLIFEDVKEQIGRLSFTPALATTIIPNEVVVQPKLSINIDMFPSVKPLEER